MEIVSSCSILNFPAANCRALLVFRVTLFVLFSFNYLTAKSGSDILTPNSTFFRGGDIGAAI